MAKILLQTLALSGVFRIFVELFKTEKHTI